MTNGKIIGWQAEQAKYRAIISDASAIIEKLPVLRSSVTDASSAFENVVITAGKPYDEGKLKEYNNNLGKAYDNFQSLISECNAKIEELQAKIDAERAALQQAAAARKAAAQKKNKTSTKNSSSSSSTTKNRYAEPWKSPYN